MRPHALLLMPLLLASALLSGCGYVGDPTDGFGGFVGDVFALRSNPNQPLLDSPNARRVMGAEVAVIPLEAEPGNVWPGPLPPAKTIADLQREQGQAIDGMPLRSAPEGRQRGSAPAAPVRANPPAAFAPIAPPSPPAVAVQPAIAPRGRVLQTPGGPATTTIGGNGVETFIMPSGRTGIVMPNANGSLTLIGPDGTTQTVPAPR